jgi:hypothetical protein
MRNWWILSGLFIGLSGCGMFGDEDEGSSDEDESEEDEKGSDFERCDGVDFASLRGGEGGIRGDQSADDDSLANLLPDSVELLVAVQDLKQVVGDYKDFLDPSRAGDHEMGEQIREMHREVQETLGFDISNPDDWEKTGIDFERPWAIAFHGVNLDADPPMSMVVPLADRKTFRSSLDSLLESEGKQLDCSKKGGGQICTLGGDVDEMKLILTSDYAVILINDSKRLAGQFLGDEKKLKDRERFVQIYDRLPGDWNALIWLSEGMTDVFLKEEQSASEYRDLEDLNEEYGSGDGTGLWGLGMTASATLNHVEFDMVGGADWLDHFSEYMACSGKDSLASKLDGDAFAAIRASMNIEGIMQLVLEEDEVAEEWEVTRESMESSIGVDLQDDIILNLDGNTTIVGLGGDTPGLIYYLGLKDGKKGAEVLETIFEELGKQEGFEGKIKESKVDGDTWYVVTDDGIELGLAAVKSNLVLSVAMGEGQIASIQESLESGKGELLENFSSRSVRTLESGAPYVLLLNIPSLVDAVLDNPEFQEQMDLKPRDIRKLRTAKRLIGSCAGDLSISGGIDGDAMLGVARLESGSGDFAPCIELALEQQ